MPLRPFRYPHDVSNVLAITVSAFQYDDPDQQVWSVPIDLELALERQLGAIQRLYPLLWMARWFSSEVGTILRGFVYEEGGRAVGTAMTARLFKAPYFEMGNVGVMAEYRRRGIAKALVEACIEDVQHLDAELIHLTVIEGNDPAIKLYQDLGFATIGGSTELTLHPKGANGESVVSPLPTEYRFRRIGFTEWEPRYALTKRISPHESRLVFPVVPEQFQWLGVLRWVAPLFYRWSGARFIGVVVETQDGMIVGTADITIQIDNNAANTLRLSVDPDHSAIISAFFHHCISLFVKYSGEHIILMSVERWQTWVVEAAVACGFDIDYHQLRMALRLR